jgi:LysM repeat protein
MKHKTPVLLASVLAEALVLSLSPGTLAQDFPPEEAPATQGQGVSVIQLPPPPPQQVVVPGYPAPGSNLESHLPSSARATSDVSRSADGFDLNQSDSGASTVRGSEGGSYVIEGLSVPEAHTVRRGDTLWDISTRYYQNPYSWPRVWGQNPQIQNPHFIYPGDQIRLRESDGSGGPGNIRTGSTIGSGGPGGGSGSGRRVPPQTIFLREVGFVDDKTDHVWGELVGSPGENMLLAEGHVIYAKIEDKHEVAAGDLLTIFRPLNIPTGGKGQLVSIRGTLKVDRYNSKTHMVRGEIIESVDVIERGAKVGPVARRFDVVAPIVSDKDIEAKIIASLYPYQLFGKEQVVFIDKGEKDGIKPGQRFFAVRRADLWQNQVRGTGRLTTIRPRVEDDRPAKDDNLPHGFDSKLFPEETYAELRVLHVRDHTAAALVTASSREVERNAMLISRKGF